MTDYFDVNAISNTALSLFNYSPELYYKTYITQELSGKKKTEGFEYGTFIHLLLFENQLFNQKYTITQFNSVEAKMGTFLTELAKFEIIDEVACKYAHEKAEFKHSVETIVKKVFNPDKPNDYKKYLDHLISSKGKLCISQEQYDAAKAVAEVSNQAIYKYFFEFFNIDRETLEKEWDEYNELEIYWEENGRKYKSKLDKVFIHKSGTMYLYVDAKTDSKQPSFKYNETFNYYKTYRQLAFYRRALHYFCYENYKTTPGKEFFAICAISSVNDDTLLYGVDTSYIAKGELELRNDIKLLEWHEQTGNWKYPKSVYDHFELNKHLKLVALDEYLNPVNNG